MGKGGRGRTTAAVLALTLALATQAACTSDAGDDTAPDAQQSTTVTTSILAVERELPVTTETTTDPNGFRVYRPVDLDATGERLPVVVWANGGCVRYDQPWAPLLERWAASGFVVVAITAPPDVDDPRSAGQSGVEDQARAIDWAVAQSSAVDGPYAGRLDLERVIAAGNSCGGITALGLTATDDRVRGAFVLSGSSVVPGGTDEQIAAVMGEIDVPVGYAVGGPEDIASDNATRDLEQLPVGVPAYLARRAEGTHPVVSTDPDILAEVAEISTNWIDLVLTGDPRLERALLEPCSSCPPGTWIAEARDLPTLAVG